MRRVITILIFVLLSTMVAQGQGTVSIKIGGNVYGGGNKGKVEGNTRVTVKAGDIGYTDKPDNQRPLDNPTGRVFGGARMADVGGNAFVHIDGENATGYMVINHVYGGNDIAGHIGKNAAKKKLPSELTEVKRKAEDANNKKKNNVDETWDSYVRVSTKTNNDGTPAANAEKTYIGQLFAGGNGDFDYVTSDPDENGKVTHTVYNRSDHTTPLATKVTAAGEEGFNKPELNKA